MVSHSIESVRHHGRLADGVRLLGTGVLNCAERPKAVVGEAWALTHGTVHDALRRVKHEPDAPDVHFFYGSHDKLFPAFAQLVSIEGLPLDTVLPYEGGHNRLATDPTLAMGIFAADAPALVA